MQTGIDFSFASITGAQIKAAGYSFVVRYLASSAGKAVTAAQVADYHANDLGLVLVFEDYANQALNGYDQGVADAKEALAQANAVGLPSDRPIYFAIDFDEQDTPLQNGDIYAYLDGAASVIGLNRVGVYGGYYVVMRCIQNGHATWAWQTLAWSGGLVFAGAHLYQNGNSAFSGGADVNQALKVDFGQWPLQGETDNMDPQDCSNAYKNYLGLDVPASSAACQNRQPLEFFEGLIGQLSGMYFSEVDGYNGAMTELDAERKGNSETIADLQAQLAACQNKPVPTPIPTPTPTPTKLPGWLQAIINALTGKK